MAEPVRRIRTAQARERATNTPEPAPKRVARSNTTKVEQGVARATSVAYEQEEERTEILTERRFEPGQEPAFVRFSAGKTLSLGAPYEFLRIDVAVTLPCLPSELQETYDVAAEFVSEKLMEEEIVWLGTPKKSANKRG